MRRTTEAPTRLDSAHQTNQTKPALTWPPRPLNPKHNWPPWSSRFNEFWSVNKMRYMNLACLLMTLVCLVTILLFSKTNQQVGVAQSSAQHGDAKLAGVSTVGRRRLVEPIGRERALESLESIERQPLNSLANSGHRSSASDADGAEDEGAPASTTTTPATAGKQPPSSLAGLFGGIHRRAESFGEMLEDARRQLGRQQAAEREAESEEGAAGQGEVEAGASQPPAERPVLGPLQPALGQVFDDLDNFGLFKTLKAQLFQGANMTPLSKPIVGRNRNGATIIMSFESAGANSTSTANANSTAAANATDGRPARPPANLVGPIERLLPLLFRPPPADLLLGSARDRTPSGFAALTINSEPVLRFPFGPALFGPPPALPLVNPFAFPSLARASPGGLNGLLMRGGQPAAIDQVAAKNSTNGGGGEALERQSSHKAAVVARAGSHSGSSHNSTSGAAEGEPDEEVETFDVSQLGVPRLLGSMGPFGPMSRGSVFSLPSPLGGARSSAGRLPSVIMIGSSSGSVARLSPFANSSRDSLQLDSPFSGAAEGPLDGAPHMIMLAGREQPPLSPMLRAILGSVLPSMARSLEQRGQQEQQMQARRDEHELAESDSDSDWDEQQLAESRNPVELAKQHRGFIGSPMSPFSATVERERESASGAGSSLIEQVLESTSAAAALGGEGGAPTGRLSGTIKQIFRGPGMTVERIIQLPAVQKARLNDGAEVQAVERGLRMQSISRIDSSIDDESDGQAEPQGPQESLRPPPHLAHFSSAHHGPETPVAGLMSRLFGSLGRQPGAERELGGAGEMRQARTFKRPPPATAEANDELDEDSAEQEEAPEAPVNAGSSTQKERHQEVPARAQRFMGLPIVRSINEHQMTQQQHQQQQQQQQESGLKSPFTSPNSPLFGFPVLKTNGEQASLVGSDERSQSRPGDAAHTRPFVYHSNHELASGLLGRSSQQHHQSGAESRPGYQHRPASAQSVAAGLQPALSMGRRLDEGELIS